MRSDAVELRIYQRECIAKQLEENAAKIKSVLLSEQFGIRVEQLQAKCKLSKKAVIQALADIAAVDVDGYWTIRKVV